MLISLEMSKVVLHSDFRNIRAHKSLLKFVFWKVFLSIFAKAIMVILTYVVICVSYALQLRKGALKSKVHVHQKDAIIFLNLGGPRGYWCRGRRKANFCGIPPGYQLTPFSSPWKNLVAWINLKLYLKVFIEI